MQFLIDKISLKVGRTLALDLVVIPFPDVLFPAITVPLAIGLFEIPADPFPLELPPVTVPFTADFEFPGEAVPFPANTVPFPLTAGFVLTGVGGAG